jgi:hypothetical protein
MRKSFGNSQIESLREFGVSIYKPRQVKGWASIRNLSIQLFLKYIIIVKSYLTIQEWRGVMEKMNCWESKSCGRGESCPAYLETRLDGVHDGVNAGRSCWVVAGTLCGGQVQGMFAQKMSNCKSCDFYKLVQKEEPNFMFSDALLEKLT